MMPARASGGLLAGGEDNLTCGPLIRNMKPMFNYTARNMLRNRLYSANGI